MKHIIDENDRFKLLIAGAVFFVFLAGYVAYSVEKYKALQVRSLVKSNVVMKVIQHNVYSVCPKCGTRGIPMCPNCRVAMYWNGYGGSFVCTACGEGGFPKCQRCGEFMRLIEAQ